MKSSWEITRARSQYHFDTSIMDPRWDTVISLGRISAPWQQELEQAISAASPITWRTRGNSNDPLKRQTKEYDQEDYDLEQQGYGSDYVVSDLTYNVGPVLQQISNQFGLKQCMTRIHVQRPGQTWNLHIDKLEKWMPTDPSQVGRYFVQLTDWQPGHFWSYGNYNWSGWRAGDVTTFDWWNVPHATANAGHSPRVTLQITGVKTRVTDLFLTKLQYETT